MASRPLLRTHVLRFLTDASPDEVMRLARSALEGEAYRLRDRQLQQVVDAHGWDWRMLTMRRGVDEKLVSVKGCLFMLIPDILTDLVPRIARHKGDQAVHVAARSEGDGTVVLLRELALDTSVFHNHAEIARHRIQEALCRAGHRVSPPTHLLDRDVPADWPLGIRVLFRLERESRRAR